MAAGKASPIHVMHVVHGFGTGGIETGIRRLVDALGAPEFRHTVLTVAPGNDGSGETMPVLTLGLTGAAFLVPKLARVLRAERPDVVHSRNWATIEAVPAAWLTRTAGIVHAEHGRNLSELGGEKMRRRVIRRVCYGLADAVLTVSEEMRQYFAEQTGFPAARIELMKDGVDDDRFRPDAEARAAQRRSLGIADDAFVAGSVGRLDPVKAFPDLLDAIALLAESGIDAHVVLIGDGPHRGVLEQRIVDRPVLAGRVHLPGSASNIPAWLNAFDAFVLPSHFEGISVALLEAMAVALPAVASRVGGNAEVVIDGVTGLMFEAGRVDELAAHLGRLARSPDDRARLGHAGRDRVRAEFSFRRTAARYADLYRRLARRT